MADLSELPLPYRLELAFYKWRRIDPIPWAPLAVPLHAARVALITSAGLYRLGEDDPFCRVRGGDVSFRVIPSDTDVRRLAIGQTSALFDRQPMLEDRNLALPIDRLAELVRLGEVGSTAPRHVSFSGSITATRRLMTETGPRVAELLRSDGVHAALLVPV